MNTTDILAEPIAVKAWVEKRTVFIELADQRMISFPANRFKLLKDAPDDLLNNVELRLDGTVLRWEEIDEDISVRGILLGNFQLP
ncbi:MAG: DUF2442 domain-containing protein [Bacteroidetes bacterium]|nr:DUF2442 domain-containing protein [Bacteroidota bacterium]MBS1539974.1 DUF2442 domain-containing protein [Bacteroidota bacterium]